MTEQHIENIRNGNRGKKRTPTQRANIAAALANVDLKSRTVCPDCGKTWNKSWMTRHKTAGKCQKETR